jgi:hypothetical protein
MRSTYVLDFLERAVLALKIRGVGSNAVVRPNTLVDVGALPLYFETFASDFSTSSDSENSVVTRCVGAIVVSGPRGEGIDRVDAAAQALLDLFSSYNEKRLRGLTSRDRIYSNPRARKVARVYVVGAERSNGLVADGRYKTKISVRLEIYEE